MNKRLEKRHKRQVSRAKAQVKLSEPDLRTPEQMKAARDASRPDISRSMGLAAHQSAPTNRNHSRSSITSSAAKGDA